MQVRTTPGLAPPDCATIVVRRHHSQRQDMTSQTTLQTCCAAYHVSSSKNEGVSARRKCTTQSRRQKGNKDKHKTKQAWREACVTLRRVVRRKQRTLSQGSASCGTGAWNSRGFVAPSHQPQTARLGDAQLRSESDTETGSRSPAQQSTAHVTTTVHRAHTQATEASNRSKHHTQASKQATAQHQAHAAL